MYRFLLVVLVFLTQACAGSFSVATPGDIGRMIDNRPRMEILYNGDDIDVYDVEASGVAIYRNARAGQTIGFPVYAGNNWGEQRTFWIKGYQLVPDTTKGAPSGAMARAYVGMRCRQVYIARGQQPQPWVVDRVFAPGTNSTGCW